MAMEYPATQSPAAASGDRTRQTDRMGGSDTLSAEDVLDHLGDEYTREVLEALSDSPKTGRELAESTDVSRPTVYRRLDRLQEIGLVEATMRLRENGHHCKQFRLVVEEIDLGLSNDGFSVTIRTDTDRRQRSDARFRGPVQADD